MNHYYDRRELIALFRKYLNNEASVEERQFVESWYQNFEKEPDVLENFAEPDRLALESRMEEALRTHIASGNISRERRSIVGIFTPARIAAAASIILLFLAGIIYLVTQTQDPTEAALEIIARQEQNLAPGTDRAILTLTDGSTIFLDSAGAGLLARQGNTTVNKIEDGLVAYSGAETAPSQGTNTIFAPAGGKYRVVLPDGSKVWLNSESSVTFPTAFGESDRSVKISGEVYFEVARDVRRPFLVQIGKQQQVRVLGTHFNINAYPDEGQVTTTLLEGSIEVSSIASSAGMVRLKPGEQASASPAGRFTVRDHINTEEVVAWKNGWFQFEQADIRTVMRQLGRWYNVEVSYEGQIPTQKFTGKISRDARASEMMEILQFTGLNFKVVALPEGGKKGEIVVIPE